MKTGAMVVACAFLVLSSLIAEHWLNRHLTVQAVTPVASPIIGGAPTRPPMTRLNDEFLLLDCYFVEDQGEVYVFGELQSTSPRPEVVPWLKILFYDRRGQLLWEGVIKPDSPWGPPGGRVTFEGYAALHDAPRPGEWATFAVEAVPRDWPIEWIDLSGAEFRDVSVAGPYGRRIRGSVVNSGARTIYSLIVDIAFYDRTGRFAGSCGVDSLASFRSPILPGEAVALELDTADICIFVDVAVKSAEAEEPASYRLFLRALPVDTSTPVPSTPPSARRS